MTENDVFTELYELEQAIEEAECTGTEYRPEYKGFDTAIYAISIEPRLKALKMKCEEMPYEVRLRYENLKGRCEENLKRASKES